jgi:hypothetical protein
MFPVTFPPMVNAPTEVVPSVDVPVTPSVPENVPFTAETFPVTVRLPVKATLPLPSGDSGYR